MIQKLFSQDSLLTLLLVAVLMLLLWIVLVRLELAAPPREWAIVRRMLVFTD